MKRVELLEALYLQGKKMRELQVLYIAIQGKGIGGHDTAEGRKVLEQIEVAEVHFDRMVKELDEWWERCGESNTDSESGFSTSLELTAAEFGVSDDMRSRIEDILRGTENASPVEIKVLSVQTVNDGDDDIRI